MGLTSASAYTPLSNKGPFAKPQQKIPTSPQEYNQYLPPMEPVSAEQPISSTKHRVSYDLGIGKNQPVVSKADDLNEKMNVYQAAKFWSEHQAVNDIPNPLLIQATANKPKLSPIIPLRLADDFLAIHHDRSEEHSHPTMTAKAPIQEYDLNTPWVEMLIHEQQVKFA